MLIYSENVNCSIYNTILKIYFLILQFNMTFIYEYLLLYLISSNYTSFSTHNKKIYHKINVIMSKWNSYSTDDYCFTQKNINILLIIAYDSR